MSLQYERILIAVDGSKQAEVAFNKAIDLAEAYNSDLYIVHVLETPSVAQQSAFDDTLRVQITQNAEEIIDEYVDKAKERGLNKVQRHLEHGSPKYVISSKIPEEYDIDLIIIGATGVGAFGRFLTGSVADGVTRNAECDVLIVRNDE